MNKLYSLSCDHRLTEVDSDTHQNLDEQSENEISLSDNLILTPQFNVFIDDLGIKCEKSWYKVSVFDQKKKKLLVLAISTDKL